MKVTVKPTQIRYYSSLKKTGRFACRRDFQSLLDKQGIQVLCLLTLLPLFGAQAQASAETAAICDHAAQVASSETGVPIAVLRSITRTETGRTRAGKLQPWPWTVNMEGIGKWFDSEDAARTYVFKEFKRGARSFDVGCFQINYKWHGEAFRSIDEMFDPLANARYAAKFLKQLFAETGDWSNAAGSYHSRTPKYAKRYRTRFDRIRRDMQDQPDAVGMARAALQPEPDSSGEIKEPRQNRYPLLQQVAQTGRHGSLVPLGQSGGQVLILFGQPAEGS